MAESLGCPLVVRKADLVRNEPGDFAEIYKPSVGGAAGFLLLLEVKFKTNETDGGGSVSPQELGLVVKVAKRHRLQLYDVTSWACDGPNGDCSSHYCVVHLKVAKGVDLKRSHHGEKIQNLMR